MPHVKDRDELWVLGLLNQIIRRSQDDRDAISGSVVKKVKDAATMIKKRQGYKKGRNKKEKTRAHI